MSKAKKANTTSEEPAAAKVYTPFGIYNRLDYIKSWKRIKRKQHILESDRLSKYVEDLVAKYPEKYLEILRYDLSTDTNFNRIVSDMDFIGDIEEGEGAIEDDAIMSSLKSQLSEDDGADFDE